jgi:hypothetical protein
MSERHPIISKRDDPETRIYKQHGNVREKPVQYTGTGEAKQCYYNAQMYVLDHPDTTYVEGIIVLDEIEIPIKHAWVETDGEILELTLTEDKKVEQYFGAEYETKTVVERLDEKGSAYPLASREHNHVEPNQ